MLKGFFLKIGLNNHALLEGIKNSKNYLHIVILSGRSSVRRRLDGWVALIV